MSTSFWGLPRIEEGVPAKIIPEFDLLVKQAALLPATQSKKSQRGSSTVLRVSVGGEDLVIGTLREGQVEQLTGLDIVFNSDEELEFTVEGPGVVCLIGAWLAPEDDEGDEYDDYSDSESIKSGEEGSLSSSSSSGAFKYDDGKYGDDSVDSDLADDTTSKAAGASRKRSAPGDDADAVMLEGAGLDQPLSKKARRKARKAAERLASVAATERPAKQQQQKQPVQTGERNGAEKQPSKVSPKQAEKVQPKAAAQKDAIVTKRFPNGLIVEELRVGGGALAKPGHNVFVKYVGKLMNGKTFDSSLNSPFKFRLGVGQVIDGWDKGVQGMKVGGRRRLIIPPALAYGREGSPPTIPPNSTLQFEIEYVR